MWPLYVISSSLDELSTSFEPSHDSELRDVIKGEKARLHPLQKILKYDGST
jgi:hypothetical protein